MTAPRPPRLNLVHAIAAALDPERYFRWRRVHDGDPFVVRFPRLGEVLFTGTPTGAADIFRAAMDLSEPPQPNPIAPLVGDASLILVAGEQHRRDRALLLPPLHGQRMRAYGRVIRDAAIAETARWQPGATVDSQQASRSITLRVILEAVFGVDSHDRRDRYARIVREFLSAYSGVLLLAPALRRRIMGLGPWARFLRLRDEFDALLTADIERRRSKVDNVDDVLGMLLTAQYDDGSRMGDADLREQLRTLLVAGHETTATSVVWALFHLHREPAVLGRLLTEIESLGPDPEPDALAKLPYLAAVCQETLRLHPTVPIVLRRLRGPLTVNGVPRRAGDIVGVALPLLHSDSAVWSDARRFDPDRFLGRRYSPFEYAPFGGGHRRCVGFALAEYEMRIVIATIVSRVRLRLPASTRRSAPPTAVPRNIATGPRRPIHFDVVARVA